MRKRRPADAVKNDGVWYSHGHRKSVFKFLIFGNAQTAEVQPLNPNLNDELSDIKVKRKMRESKQRNYHQSLHKDRVEITEMKIYSGKVLTSR